MSYQIYNDTATLKVVENGQTKSLAKGLVKVEAFGDYLIIGYDGNENYIKVLYTSVTVPSSASADALRNTINGYLVQSFSASVDVSTLATEATLQDVLTAVQNIEIDADSVNLNTDQLEDKLDVVNSNLTDGSQTTTITDGAGVVNTRQLSDNITDADVGLIVHSVIHGHTTAGGGGYVDVKVNPSGSLVVADDDVLTELQTINSLVPSQFDYISLSYTGSNVTTVVYKNGGSGGTTVSTLTLTYDGNDNLTSVTKS